MIMDEVYQKYLALLCEKLNEKGFKDRGEDYIVGPYIMDGAIMRDLKAVDYLKSIGLLDNGVCPRCGKRINYTHLVFTGPNGASYSLCQDCYEKGQRFKAFASDYNKSVWDKVNNSHKKKDNGCLTIVVIGLFIATFLVLM